MIFIGNKKDVAEFVDDLARFSDIDYQSITIMPREKSEDYYVLIVIGISWEDTVETKALRYCLKRITTSWVLTQGG